MRMFGIPYIVGLESIKCIMRFYDLIILLRKCFEGREKIQKKNKNQHNNNQKSERSR